MNGEAPTCGFACTILENANNIPFKSASFCTNLNNGFRYDNYFFRSDLERNALTSFCGKTCGEISSVVCGSDDQGGAVGTGGNASSTFEWSPLLFKSVFRDCCDDYDATCSFCPPHTELEYPEKQVMNHRTTFNATCAQFETWFDLEWWSHRMGRTLDSYGPPSGNPTYSCSELRYRDPIWSPIREWASLDEDCPCVVPAPSLSPTQSPSPTNAPSNPPTVTSSPSASIGPSRYPSLSPSKNPLSSRANKSERTEVQQCSPKPSETFASIGSLVAGAYVAGTYAYLFYFKSKKAGRPRWGIYEMVSEVFGQFVATVIGVGVIVICQNSEEYSSDEGSGVILSMTSLLAVDGFELILTLATVPFMGPDDHPEDTFDKARWNQLNGCCLGVMLFLIWCVGTGLPLVIFFFDELYEESLAIMIPCFMSLGAGMLIGFFGPCVVGKPGYARGGRTRLIWMLIKELVGVIPGLIVAIANKDWIALGWGAELFIEISHLLGECSNQ